MAVIIRLLKSIIKQSGQSIVRSRNMSIASIGSVSATLLILGVVLMLVLNMTNITNTTKEDFDQVQAYLEIGLNDEQIANLSKQVKAIDGVKSIEFIGKKQALQDMKERFEENESILEGLEENPLQHSYIIYLDDVEKTEEVVKQVEQLKGIDDVSYYKDIIDKLVDIADITRVGGIILIGLLLVVSIFIISNTIKITVMARQTEISIMKYVGAANGFIRGPFIIEGTVLGIIGAVISIVVVLFGYKYVTGLLSTSLYKFLSIYIVPTRAVVKDIVIIFISIGAGVGMIGSLISLRRFLKV